MECIPLREVLEQVREAGRAEFFRSCPWPVLVLESSETRPLTDSDTGDTGREEQDFPDLSNIESSVYWLHREGDPDARRFTVGRSRKCDLRVSAKTVSKLHALLERSEAGVWRVSDRGSTNGTWLRRMQLRPQEAIDLRDGDSLRFGPEVRVRFFGVDAFSDYVGVLLRFGRGEEGER